MTSSLTQRADAPARSVEQRRRALAQANQVRMQRAALKAQLKRGELPIVALIEDPPQHLASARIAELFKALPTYGPIRVERLLKRCQVSPRKTVAGLNMRQRREIIEALNKYAADSGGRR